MFRAIINFIRKRKIGRDRSNVPTGFIPVSSISSADIVIDVEDPEFEGLQKDISAWGRSNGISTNIFFLDFRKADKNAVLLSDEKATILKKELNWYGLPPQEKAAMLSGEGKDLFISMISNGDFPIEYISKCSKARFKIGRQRFAGDAFDMVLSGENGSPVSEAGSRQVFTAIADFLTKIR